MIWSDRDFEPGQGEPGQTNGGYQGPLRVVRDLLGPVGDYVWGAQTVGNTGVLPKGFSMRPQAPESSNLEWE